MDAIIGADCSVACIPVALLAAAWGIPTLSYGCASYTLSNKQSFPTFTRTSGISLHSGNILSDVALVFDWNHVGIIVDGIDLYFQTYNTLVKHLKESHVTMDTYTFESTVSGSDFATNIQKLRQILLKVKASCRVIFLLMYSLDVRNALAIAYEEDMLAGYAYLGTETEMPVDIEDPYRPDLDSAMLFEGVIDLEMGVTQGPAWDAFRQQVIDYMQLPVFDGWKRASPNEPISSVSPYAGVY